MRRPPLILALDTTNIRINKKLHTIIIMKSQPKFNIGVSVIVKANVKDPDYDIKIEGWQGRVTQILDRGNLINVKWDSITLENMPGSLIDECEEEGFDWSETYRFWR